MTGNTTDLICLSHLRWNFVYQRPQHLLSRFARTQRVFFFEEPFFSGGEPRLEIRIDGESGVHVVVPHLPGGLSAAENERLQGQLLTGLIRMARMRDYFFWYYTPMALGFSGDLSPSLVVYDCMDELSAFKDAPAELHQRELELFRRADLVFTGGHTLYEAKRGQHPDVHAFPSSVDVEHFAQARVRRPDLPDQAAIPHPRVGFCGVIDERLDIALLAGAAQLRPEVQFVMIGPVVKIDPASLPKLPNIHYLGPKSYKELPAHMAGWDGAMLPFARNESTRFISPTKTPEYLAAGLPSVSTSIRDVVRPYGDLKLVEIADTPETFAAALDTVLTTDRGLWLARVDEFLKSNSWDVTWRRMMSLIGPRLDNPRLDKTAERLVRQDGAIVTVSTV